MEKRSSPPVGFRNLDPLARGQTHRTVCQRTTILNAQVNRNAPPTKIRHGRMKRHPERGGIPSLFHHIERVRNQLPDLFACHAPSTDRPPSSFKVSTQTFARLTPLNPRAGIKPGIKNLRQSVGSVANSRVFPFSPLFHVERSQRSIIVPQSAASRPSGRP